MFSKEMIDKLDELTAVFANYPKMSFKELDKILFQYYNEENKLNEIIEVVGKNPKNSIAKLIAYDNIKNIIVGCVNND